MNWKEERASLEKNYCGYCIGSPPSANCDGTCFSRGDYSNEKNLKIKIDHLESNSSNE